MNNEYKNSRQGFPTCAAQCSASTSFGRLPAVWYEPTNLRTYDALRCHTRTVLPQKVAWAYLVDPNGVRGL